ncbi:MAG: hypothetical protein ACFE7R_10115 [Candidatus Hodarchaeota archaeon]
MVSSKREIARRIIFGYIIIGLVFFAWYVFLSDPTDYEIPFVATLFYIFLPAGLLAPYVLLELAADELPGLIGRFRKRKYDFRLEVIDSEETQEDATPESEEQ